MDVIFPNYLNDDGFKFRHVKIKIMQNEEKMDTPEAMKSLYEKKSDELKKALSESVTDFSVGSASEFMESARKATAKFEGVFKANTNAIHNIVLPLPNSLIDSASHEWSAETGVAGSLLGGLDSSVIGKATKIATNNANLRKPLIDPGYFQSYAGTQPRNFSLSFDLIPNNAEDAGNIYIILNLLKKYSSPSTVVANAMVLSPHFFQLEFTNPYFNTLINTSDVVLKDITIDYGADGYMQQTADGIPKHIKLDLTFAERHMMTAEMYGGN